MNGKIDKHLTVIYIQQLLNILLLTFLRLMTRNSTHTRTRYYTNHTNKQMLLLQLRFFQLYYTRAAVSLIPRCDLVTVGEMCLYDLDRKSCAGQAFVTFFCA